MSKKEVEVSLEEMIDFISARALENGYPLTRKEIYEVVMCQHDFVEMKIQEAQEE